MESVNIHDAKTHLSRLVDRAAAGETVILAKAGRPVARLAPLEAVSSGQPRRTGFLAGRVDVPDDFDHMGADEIGAAFDGIR
jgi:prevent-host-death family protein